jgi:hypothetical protein
MKTQKAYTAIEDLLARSEKKSAKKAYEQLLGVLNDLKGRDFSVEQLQQIEEALDQLPMQGGRSKELEKSSRQFVKFVSKTLSLIPEGYYIGLGLAFGVAFGAAFGPIVQRTTGMGLGTSGTGLGVGIGLIIGFMIGSYLDAEATKKNRVLKTSIK